MIRVIVSLMVLGLTVSASAAAKFERVGIKADGFPTAIVVDNDAMLHTGQILPWTREGKLAPAADQPGQVLDNLEVILKDAGSSYGQIVRLNLHGDRTTFAAFIAAFDKRAGGKETGFPTVTLLPDNSPHPDVRIAIDVVALAKSVEKVELLRLPAQKFDGDSAGAILPAGPRVYVSGQAEKAETLAEATRKTLQSLRAMLKVLGLSDSHVVQCKSFMSPMSERAVVVKEFEAFFGKGKVPPLVFVEWKMPLPIEIELIAHSPATKRKAWDEIDYLTPPGVTASPIYSRVTRVNANKSVYYTTIRASDGDSKAQVERVFTQLDKLLKATGSDFRHLVKATYYVTNDDVSKQLNALRPNYYDPRRPPAASKAMVANIEPTKYGVAIDMIAVPSSIIAEGKPEFGHGLTAAMARDGWLSLFDGKSTFGWEGSKVADGVLSGGRTTSSFDQFELIAEIITPGTITVAGNPVKVEKGKATLTAGDRRGPIILGDGVSLRSLVIKPRDLKSIMVNANWEGWKRIDRMTITEASRPKWTLNNGLLEVTGGPGALEYSQAFANQIVQIEARSRNRHANGGLFVRSIPGDFMNGYEAQIHSACVKGDPSKPAEYATGGIDDRQNARRLISRDFEPFTMTVLADGPHLATWVNGYQVTDWTDTRKEDPNARKGLRLEAGTLQLQAHDPATDLEFRKIMIRELK